MPPATWSGVFNSTNMELLMTYKYKELKVDFFYIGTSFLATRTYLFDELVMEDISFRPSPLHDIDSPDSVVSFLTFITLQDGDTDDETREAIQTPKLRAWADEDSEAVQAIRLACYDWEILATGSHDDDESRQWAIKFTQEIIKDNITNH